MTTQTTDQVLHRLSVVLTTPCGDEQNGRLQGHGVRSAHELLAVLVHAVMSLSGFRLQVTDDVADNDLLPSDWNTHAAATGDSWTFRYLRPGEPSTDTSNYIVKCVCLFDKLLLHVMSLMDKKVYTAEVATQDYVKTDAQLGSVTWPLSALPAPSLPDGGLGQLFCEPDSVQQFAALLDSQLIQPLLATTASAMQPDATAGQESSTSSQMRASQPSSTLQYGSNSMSTGDYNIGSADLDPLAASPHFVGPGGIRFPGQREGQVGGNGMLVGPEHPIFRPTHQNSSPSGIFGGPQPLPRGSVPPGARFDPIGPFGEDPTAPARPGRGRLDHFSGSPDNDELPPPGFGFGNRGGNRGGNQGGNQGGNPFF